MSGSVPYTDPGVNQVDVAMRRRNYGQVSRADVPERRGSISLTFSGGGSCREHTWPCDHISSPARGHLVDFGYQEAEIIGLANAWSLMSRTVLNSLLRVSPLKPLIASTEG